jgi:hypothetical protein
MKKYFLETIVRSIYFYIFAYYLLIASFLPISARITKISSNDYISSYFTDVHALLVFAVVPSIIFLINIFRYKNYSFENFLNIFLPSFLIVFPIGTIFQLGLFTIGHYGWTWNVILQSGKLGCLFGGLGILLGLLSNSIYILIYRLIKKH